MQRNSFEFKSSYNFIITRIINTVFEQNYTNIISFYLNPKVVEKKMKKDLYSLDLLFKSQLKKFDSRLYNSDFSILSMVFLNKISSKKFYKNTPV